MLTSTLQKHSQNKAFRHFKYQKQDQRMPEQLYHNAPEIHSIFDHAYPMPLYTKHILKLTF